jgi:hypothetical protein
VIVRDVGLAFALLAALPALAIAKPAPKCDDTNVPIDGGTLILHDCVVATKPGRSPLYDEHSRKVILRFVPLQGPPLDVELAPVSDGYESREAWRVAGVLKDETSSAQAVMLALDAPGGLTRIEVRKIGAAFPLLWKSPPLIALALDVQRSRATVQGKIVPPAADLDELESHGTVETMRLVLRDGRITEKR